MGRRVLRDYKKCPVVWVRWDDAGYVDGPFSLWDTGHVLCKLVTVGFLVEDTDELVAIAKDWNFEDDSCRHVSVIPKRNIVQMRVLAEESDYREVAPENVSLVEKESV